MKALSVRSPWAQLIVAGLKDVENRSWRMHYRGPLLIHAGRHDRFESIKHLPRSNPHRIIFDDDQIGTSYGIIGIVDLVDCVRDSDSEWALPGCWHWVLVNPVQFQQPIIMPGRLSSFDVDVDICTPVAHPNLAVAT